MTRILGKLLILMALLAMPLGMSAPANAAAEQHPMDHAAMSHCDDSGPADTGAEPGIAACTMACSAALPAIGPIAAVELAAALAPVPALPMKPLLGVLLEIATPPPRAA